MKRSYEEPVKQGADAGPIPDGPPLEFPVDPGFISYSPPVSADVLYELNLAQAKFFNSRPGADEQRLREKCDVPFEI